MPSSETTCWTMIAGAAAGSGADREAFVRHYAPVVRALFNARWRAPSLRDLMEDAVQDVFLDCFRDGGVLQQADRAKATSFKSYIYGVARIVALRYESRAGRRREGQVPDEIDLEAIPSDEDRVSAVFDRAWAVMVLNESLERLGAEATAKGETALRRVDLLRQRIYEDRPIREIARRWQADAAVLHHEYARARKEFKIILLEVLAFHGADPAPDPDQALEDLLALIR